MAYADFTFYSTQYLGTAIAESTFPQLALRASAVVDQITFGRAVSQTVAADVTAIKNAMCAVAEELQRQDASNGADGIASESQGQYSVSYIVGSNRSKSNTEKLQSAASVWLANTYLMFAGFNTDEYGGTLDDS